MDARSSGLHRGAQGIVLPRLEGTWLCQHLFWITASTESFHRIHSHRVMPRICPLRPSRGLKPEAGLNPQDGPPTPAVYGRPPSPRPPVGWEPTRGKCVMHWPALTGQVGQSSSQSEACVWGGSVLVSRDCCHGGYLSERRLQGQGVLTRARGLSTSKPSEMGQWKLGPCNPQLR